MAWFALASNLSFSAGMLIVAFMVMFAAPVRACNRYFASFMAARGLVTAVNQAEALGARGAWLHALHELGFWLDLMAAGTLLAFLLVYTAPHRQPWARRIRFGTLVVATALTVLVADSSGRSFFAIALPVGEAATAAVLVWILATGRAPARLETDWLFAMAFIPLAMIDGLLVPNLVTALGLWGTNLDDPLTIASYVIHGISGLVAFGAGIGLVLATRRTPAMHGRGAGVLALIGLVVIALGLPHITFQATGSLTASLFLAGLVRFIVPLIAAYGLIRYRLFIPTKRFRVGLNRSAMAVIFAAMYFVATEGTAAFVGGKQGDLVGILAAVPLVLIILPFQRAINRVTDGIVPPEPSTGQPAKVRTRAYREQVELAWMDGQLDVKERMMLDRASAHLGLSREAAAQVEESVLRRVARSQYA